jgi:hypothetical protein
VVTVPVNTYELHIYERFALFLVDVLDELACLHVIRSASAYLRLISVMKLSCKLLEDKRYCITWGFFFLAKRDTKKINKAW